MPNFLQQLENDEAILLMYLAGELPDGDRAEMEQTLAADAALRAELADLAAIHDGVNTLLAHSDAGRHAARCEAAVRAVSRAVTAAAAQRPALRLAGANSADEDAPATRRPFRIAWWAYPIAAAAIVIIGIMIYPGQKPKPNNNTQIATSQELPDTPPVRIFPADDSLTDVEQGVYSLRTGGSSFFDEPAAAELPDLDR